MSSWSVPMADWPLASSTPITWQAELLQPDLAADRVLAAEEFLAHRCPHARRRPCRRAARRRVNCRPAARAQLRTVK